jgi:hypothetical protein
MNSREYLSRLRGLLACFHQLLTHASHILASHSNVQPLPLLSPTLLQAQYSHTHDSERQ